MKPVRVVPIDEETGERQGSRSLVVRAESWKGATLLQLQASDAADCEFGGLLYLGIADARAAGMRLVLDAEAAGSPGPAGRQIAERTSDRGWVWRVALRSQARAATESAIVRGDGNELGAEIIADQIKFWGGDVPPWRVWLVLEDLASFGPALFGES